MLDLVYKILLTILSKDTNGTVSPTEFNLLATNVQAEIFREYFEDENRDKTKKNRGVTNRGYANLDFNVRQRINQFSDLASISITTDKFNLPENLYFIEDDGIVTGDSEAYVGKVIEEAEKSQLNYLKNSIAKPTALYPIYERYGNYIVVEPSTIASIKMSYLRTPKAPNWTYMMISNQPLYNPSDVSFQDFELHESELNNIVLKMLTYFGINLREPDIVQIAELLKDKQTVKEDKV